MVTKAKSRSIKKALRNADDILFLFTGKRLKHVFKKGAELFGEEMARKAARFLNGSPEQVLPPDNPYSILGVHPDALDIVVKGAYRSLAREYHPDTGEKPDPAKLQQVTEAYNAIMAERQSRKAPAGSSL